MEFIGPASAIIGGGRGYACEVKAACGTEVFCDGRTFVEFPKARVESSLGPDMPADAQPMASLAMKGSYGVSLDEKDCMEVFEGGYHDDEFGKVTVRCHVGAVYAVPADRRRPDGAVVLSNGSGILTT